MITMKKEPSTSPTENLVLGPMSGGELASAPVGPTVLCIGTRGPSASLSYSLVTKLHPLPGPARVYRNS